MLTIFQSRLCLELFKDRLDLPPFPGLSIPYPYHVLMMPDEEQARGLSLHEMDLILYTNIWPVTHLEDQARVIFDTVRLNSVSVGVVATFDQAQHDVVYPRKSDVCFPAQSVAYLTLHPGLLWRQTLESCFFESVSMAMFASLAYDVVFRSILIVDRTEPLAVAEQIRQEYAEAHDGYPELGLEIHGYRTKAKVPYADL